MLLQTGQIVYSKAGRDSGATFVVVAMDGDFAYIVNGESRPLARAKKKKARHIQPTNHIDQAIAAKLTSGVYVNDAEIVKLLKAYKPESKEVMHV
ncbi:MAG: KOW domain-containing RNA-binding protein [Defluviitaleaceae bacterium]|nr:KOW domain-containing RNA-binding protein [Defluviitaleaceae bacterium]